MKSSFSLSVVHLHGSIIEHSFSSNMSPSHCSPPHLGFGALHVRSLVVLPLLHGLHNDHSLKPPSTMRKETP